MHLNIEIKANCHDPAPIREYLLNNHAECKGMDTQTDTYFHVTHGRLKLRQGNIENALIHYSREDQEGPKKSQVSLYPVIDSDKMLQVLTCALGIKVIVRKEREIWFIGNVKFHIDKVDGLGHFVEIEAIDKDGSIGQGKLSSQCSFYMEAFNIRVKDLLSLSYSDMLMAETK